MWLCRVPQLSPFQQGTLLSSLEGQKGARRVQHAALELGAGGSGARDAQVCSAAAREGWRNNAALPRNALRSLRADLIEKKKKERKKMYRGDKRESWAQINLELSEPGSSGQVSKPIPNPGPVLFAEPMPSRAAHRSGCGSGSRAQHAPVLCLRYVLAFRFPSCSLQQQPCCFLPLCPGLLP